MNRNAPQPFFLPAQTGQRFCLYHSPNPPHSPVTAGCVLHIHAFAEEMNRCRRMAAVTASRLASQGLGVLQMDLYGCGDSSADFADATWDSWKSDLELALAWLNQKHAGPVSLWADRLGALLALDFLRTVEVKIDRLLLCQPVMDGTDYLNRLNRMQLARQMLNKPTNDASAMVAMAALTAEIGIEIAGYNIAASLIRTMTQLQPADWLVPVNQIHWLEMTRQSTQEPTQEPTQGMPNKRQQFLAHWQTTGNPVQLHLINGPSYWQTPEVSVSTEWIAACSNAFRDAQS